MGRRQRLPRQRSDCAPGRGREAPVAWDQAGRGGGGDGRAGRGGGLAGQQEAVAGGASLHAGGPRPVGQEGAVRLAALDAAQARHGPVARLRVPLVLRRGGAAAAGAPGQHGGAAAVAGLAVGEEEHRAAAAAGDAAAAVCGAGGQPGDRVPAACIGRGLGGVAVGLWADQRIDGAQQGQAQGCLCTRGTRGSKGGGVRWDPVSGLLQPTSRRMPEAPCRHLAAASSCAAARQEGRRQLAHLGRLWGRLAAGATTGHQNTWGGWVAGLLEGNTALGESLQRGRERWWHMSRRSGTWRRSAVPLPPAGGCQWPMRLRRPAAAGNVPVGRLEA